VPLPRKETPVKKLNNYVFIQAVVQSPQLIEVNEHPVIIHDINPIDQEARYYLVFLVLYGICGTIFFVIVGTA
jgi:hypothetical protein